MKRSLRLIVTAGVIALVTLAATPLRSQVFTPPVNVSNTGRTGLVPRMALDGAGNPYVVWADASPGNSHIFFARSTDGGNTFLPPIDISPQATYALTPQIVVDDPGLGNIYVVWEADRDIFLSTSANGGSTFSAPINISGSTARSFNPQLAVVSPGPEGPQPLSLLYIVWVEEGSPTNSDIYFLRGEEVEGQITWRPVRNISQSGGDSMVPQLGVSGAGAVSVVWYDYSLGEGDILFRHSPDGINFFPSRNLSENLPRASLPRLAVDPYGTAYVVWHVVSSSEEVAILFARIVNGTNLFGPAVLSLSGGVPSLALDEQGSVYVAWYTIPGSYIALSHSDDGLNFSPPGMSDFRVSSQEGEFPLELAVDGRGVVNVVALSHLDDPQVLFTRSSDGVRFSPPTNVSSTLIPRSHFPQLALEVGGSNAYVVWSNRTLDGTDIFFSREVVAPGSTPPGDDVVVQPVDETTGTSPVTLAFDSVTQGGETTVTTSGAGSGPPPPQSLRLGNPPTYYEISTTADFTGGVTICIDYTGISYGNENNLKLYHFDGSGWVDVTLSLDTENNIICGLVTSLSFFAIMELDVQPAGLQAPLAALAQEGADMIFPGKAFKQGRTLPLKLELFAGGVALNAFDVSPPEIAGLSLIDEEPLDLAILDLDAGQANDSGTLFRYEDSHWVYNLSTRGLTPGTYVITLQMPDGLRYHAGFVLK